MQNQWQLVIREWSNHRNTQAEGFWSSWCQNPIRLIRQIDQQRHQSVRKQCTRCVLCVMSHERWTQCIFPLSMWRRLRPIRRYCPFLPLGQSWCEQQIPERSSPLRSILRVPWQLGMWQAKPTTEHNLEKLQVNGKLTTERTSVAINYAQINAENRRNRAC